MTDIAPTPNNLSDSVSMAEIDAEKPVALPNKEVLSLLDINANVDLGLDLAAPVDLAVAANLNVAAPIEAAATANVLSPDAQAVGLAEQQGTLHQDLSGSATATAPQHAGIDQTTASGQTAGSGTATDGVTPATPDATANDTAIPVSDTSGGGAAADGAVAPTDSGGTAGTELGDAAGAAGGAVDGVAGSAPSTLGDVGSAAGTSASDVSGGVDSLLNGGSLLDANVVVHANADLTAPIDGAVAANANVAAPVDAAVAANIGSPGATAEALAPQTLDIEQSLDNVSADATADQVANVSQH